MICRNIADASGLLRLLANPNRLSILCLLLEGERSVMELEVLLGIRQPTLSQQLAELRDAGLVSPRRESRDKHIYYRVTDDRAARVIGVLRDIYAELLPASVLLAASGPAQDREQLAENLALARLSEREAM